MTSPPSTLGHRFSTLAGITHGFFGRKGGVSTGLYDSLNIGEGSSDNPEAIAENRERVRQAVGASHLISCYQVHSPTVITVTEPWDKRPEADAMVTNKPGLALCILTADCVPILFADPKANVIGAAHAGWKGALAGVAEATIDAMETLGADRSNITAAIGPAIQQDSYEVGPEFRDTWVGTHEWTDRLFKAGECSPEPDPSRSEAQRGSNLKSHFDLTGYIQATLLREGIAAIDNVGHDTCAMEETYFSNRRRNHRGEPDYGRNGSVIILQG
jgi:hypothetical protein